MPTKSTSLRAFLKHETQKSCIWFTRNAKGQKQRCGNPISKANFREAQIIRDAMRSEASKSYVRRKIKILAALCLCKRRHQGKIKKTAKAWKKEAEKFSNAGSASHRTRILRHRTTAAGARRPTELEARLARDRQELEDMISRLCITPRDTDFHDTR